jgi:para-aminobenzoate synthetase/4-amino-4-deoxychorismate lyase
MSSEPGRALLHDETRKAWLSFSAPRRVIDAHCVDEVVRALREVENVVGGTQCWAVGFVSYEAGPAFDPAIVARGLGRFPLVWFGIYDQPVETVAPSGLPTAHAAADWLPSVTSREYRDAIGRIKEYIRSGDTYQVNYTYRLRRPCVEDPFDIFTAIASAQRAPYAAFIDTGNWVVCSASPELFFRLDGDVIESRPMKGTARRGLTAGEDIRCAESLRLSAKDRAENVMIVDMVRNDLGRIADTGSVSVSRLYDIEKYPTIWQMTTTVRAETHAGLSGIFDALFPPASVTGAPKLRTTAIIAELESTPRRVYTGALGFWAPGRRAQFNVAIRTVLVDVKRRTAEYGVGGGIVWDSDPEREREECETKARVLAAQWPEFRLLETMRWTPGEGYFLGEEHLARLTASAGYFDYPLEQEKARSEMNGLSQRLSPRPHRVRVLVDRAGRITLEAAVFTPPGADAPLRVALARSPVDSSDPFLYHKTTHRRVYEDARAGCPGSEDVILYNERGEVTESTIANVAVEIDGVLSTPPVSSGLLAGTYRALLLDRKDIIERTVTVEELLRSPRILLLNSVRGIYPVRVIGNGRTWEGAGRDGGG